MEWDMGERIRSARRARGLGMAELARLAQLPLAELSRCERGITAPGSDVLCRLAAPLGVRPTHFLRPGRTEVWCLNPRLPRRLATAIEWQAGEYLERYLSVEELLGLARHDVVASLSTHVREPDAAEERADALRREWELGLDPIANLPETLEDHGVKVVPSEGIPTDRFAVACLADGQPVIAIRLDPEADGAGQRLDIVHELGRLLVSAGQPATTSSAGRWCRRFAAALLVPRRAALAEVGEHRSELGYRELHSLKHRWGLGMLAWCERLHDLEVISSSHHRRTVGMFQSRRWHEGEPGERVKPEESFRFERLVHRAVAEDVIGPARAADLLNRPLVEVRRELGWPNP